MALIFHPYRDNPTQESVDFVYTCEGRLVSIFANFPYNLLEDKKICRCIRRIQ